MMLMRSKAGCSVILIIVLYIFFALQARATGDRSRQLRRQDSAIQTLYTWRPTESSTSQEKSQLASQVQK